jgi:small conductance mechanosensitive channel
MIEEVNITTISETLQEMLARLIHGVPALIAAIVIFVLSLYVAGLSRRAVLRALKLRNANAQVTEMLMKLTQWSVLAMGTIIALQQVGFNVTAFLAGLGIVGFTIGFALQDVSKNFISGLLLLIQQPFNIGETIEVTGFTGRVVAIDMRATEIQTADGRVVLIPNANVFTNPITNHSRTGNRRVELVLKVTSESDLDVVREAVLKASSSVPGLRDQPPPTVNFSTIEENKVEMQVYYWIDMDQTNLTLARDAGLTAIKHALDQAGIVMA